MKKLKGIALLVMGVLIYVYKTLLVTQNVAGNAVLQLENSDVLYGVGANMATSNVSLILTIVSSVFVVYGAYTLIKPKKENKKDEE